METIQVAEATNEGAHGGAVEISNKDGRIRMCIVHGIILDDDRQNQSILPRMHKLSSPEQSLEQNFIFKRINKTFIGEGNNSCTEIELDALRQFLGKDFALELKNDRTLADPWACILHGKHPAMQGGKFYLFSIEITEEVRIRPVIKFRE